jgi:hypothetical protein
MHAAKTPADHERDAEPWALQRADEFEEQMIREPGEHIATGRRCSGVVVL